MSGWPKAAGAEGAPAKEKAEEAEDPAGVADPEAVDPAEAEAVDPAEAEAVDPAEAGAVDPAEAEAVDPAEAEGLRRRNLHFDTIFSPKATGIRLIRHRGKLFIE